jgi:hypothetical protein
VFLGGAKLTLAAMHVGCRFFSICKVTLEQEKMIFFLSLHQRQKPASLTSNILVLNNASAHGVHIIFLLIGDY